MKIVNNYEISICLFKFLQYWCKTPKSVYINASDLFKDLKIDYTPLFKQYFDIYNENVDYETFFQFFCLFAFSRISNLVKILLSVCKIYSNIALTYEQTIYFFSCICPNYLEDAELRCFLEEARDHDRVSICEIETILEINNSLSIPFWQLSKALINTFFKEKFYLQVMIRKQYYDSTKNIKNGGEIIVPEESCLSKMTRILVTKQPPPYYSDYRYTQIDICNLKNIIIYNMRCKYGYSHRLVSNNSFMSVEEISSSVKMKKSKLSCILSDQYVKRTRRSTVFPDQIMPNTD